MTDYTANGVLIAVGLRVWNNDLKLGTITELAANGWHRFLGDDGRDSNFNGERLTTRHPFTGELAR